MNKAIREAAAAPQREVPKAAANDKVMLPVKRLENFCVSVLTKAGLNSQNAQLVAESLVFADLRGIGSHGVTRLSGYLGRIRAGVMNLDPTMTIEADFPASALINAANGLGQIAGMKAMALAIEKARTQGIAMVAVKNSNHFGTAAYFAMKALQHNMIGLVATNASPAMAPYGSKTPLLGTNPLAVAIPAAAQKAIVLDMATTVVARGKIRLASLTGQKIPFGWALDADGNPTDDAKAALAGSLEPIAGPKGAGLSLVIDLLCGVLTGSTLTGEVKNLVTDNSGEAKTGHTFAAINVAMFVDPEQFKADIDKVILRIKSLPSVAKRSPIYLPGEIEANLETKRRTEGIPITAGVLAGLSELADRYKVSKL
jgi:LDH2 family malate/lactate/ureidoglycolate dehydrogenase